MKILLLVAGFAILIFSEILRVYFIMPFPGSQEDETIRYAYLIHQNIGYFRLAGALLVAFPLFQYFKNGTQVIKITLAVVLGFYIVVFYMFNFRYLADKIFLQPTQVNFLSAEKNTKVKPGQLVVGVNMGRESKAYPIQYLGYHHQVRDVVDGKPVMVTYCTVCRTGRVYLPAVDGKEENFRLVGMDHYNAMFEDSRTGSWWRQVSGEAITGPLKGKRLEEIPSQQMSLEAWIRIHPETLILQPDSTFNDAYKDLADYDGGKRKGRLTRRDSLSWKDKSWVVGVPLGLYARAYDWNDLAKARVIQDEWGGQRLVLFLEKDKTSFHVWKRDSLDFMVAADSTSLQDIQTHSTWSGGGECVDGQLKGARLEVIQSYQEYWHSWKTFHPQTDQYKPIK